MEELIVGGVVGGTICIFIVLFMIICFCLESEERHNRIRQINIQPANDIFISEYCDKQLTNHTHYKMV